MLLPVNVHHGPVLPMPFFCSSPAPCACRTPRPTTDLEYVEFLACCVALMLDVVLFIALCAVVEWPLTLIDPDLYMNGTNPWIGLFQRVLWVALVLGFWRGAMETPGKRALRASIVHAQTNQRPAFWQLVVRYVAHLPFGLGFFWILWDPRKQGWHDKLAQTVVVRPVRARQVRFPEAP